MTTAHALLVLTVGTLASASDGPTDLATVVVHAGPHDRHDTTVVVSAYPKMRLAGHLAAADLAGMALTLHEQGGSKTLPAQWQRPADPPLDGFQNGALVFSLAGKTPAGTVRRFILKGLPRPPKPGAMRIEDEKGKALVLRRGERPIARYNYGLVRRYPDRENVFDRMAYFHPVWAPCGEVVTDDFTKSHPHQRGLFLAWTRTTIDDKTVDFWNLGAPRKMVGRTLHKKRSGVVAGPVFAGFIADNDLIAHERVALKETWVTRIYATPDGPWIIDLDIRHTAVDKPVTLDEYKYGGMAYRGRPDWYDRKKLCVTASDPFDAKKGMGESLTWIDMGGPLPNGKMGGLQMIDHPTNPTYPTGGRIHPKVPYYCFAFALREPYAIDAGKSLELRYRCIVHDGCPDKPQSESWARDFTDPPKVLIQPIPVKP